MIKSATTGWGLQNTGFAPLTPYVNMSNSSAGMIRYNGNNQSIEVYDGTMWYSLTGTMNLEFTTEVKELLDWAKQKREQEQRIQHLADKYPAVKDAKEQLDILMTLVEKHSQTI